MAATAAMSDIGDGLCNSFANLTECARWDSHLINEWALQLDYSNRSLSGAMDERGTARRGWAPATFVDLALGADHRPIRESDDDNNDGEQYWDRLEARVRDFIEANHPPQRLYLTGERAADRRFLTAVRNALGGPNARLPFSVENSLGLAWLKIFGGGLPII
ncbi:hypothetical protein NPX13_g9903 [Xylaria arbuscula]|uniref:Uncharacterized protein n=1 Tax=Xylaria arbuscula TaxID=114810 RepID=A0A9W8TIK9_9PEZI|nr:hypothetical protein NPX13_g9903 [Xylaria arbuscula]